MPHDGDRCVDASAVAPARARSELIADSHGRRLNLVAALVGLNRGVPLADTEEAVLSAALRVLDDRHEPGDAVLTDLVQVLEEGPEAVRRGCGRFGPTLEV